MDCRDVNCEIMKGINLPQGIVTVYLLIEISLSVKGREFVDQLGQQIPIVSDSEEGLCSVECLTVHKILQESRVNVFRSKSCL